LEIQKSKKSEVEIFTLTSANYFYRETMLVTTGSFMAMASNICPACNPNKNKESKELKLPEDHSQYMVIFTYGLPKQVK